MSAQGTTDDKGGGAVARTNTQSEARASASWATYTLAAQAGAFMLAVLTAGAIVFWT
jgi:hypothetical protein